MTLHTAAPPRGSAWHVGPSLQPGARIAVIAPSGPVPAGRYHAGRQRLHDRYQVIESAGVLCQQGYTAGSPSRRLAELRWALSDPGISAVICARGGYGLLPLMPHLLTMRADELPIRPWIGFSDITILHAVAALFHRVSMHGPVVTQLGELSPEDVSHLWALLESGEPPPPLTDLQPLVVPAPQPVHGRLLGGNLEMLSRLCGTPLQAALMPGEPVVLFIEEVNEAPYRIDRALTQLALAGALRDVVAILVGDLHRCDPPPGTPPAIEVIARLGTQQGLLVCSGVPTGHASRHHALPLGTWVRCAPQAGTLHFLDPATQARP